MKSIITTAAAAVILFSGAAVADAASSNDSASVIPYSANYVAVYTGRSVSLGRFTKTPDGNFNSTRSMLEGTSSGDGSGPYAGSPNGG
jgi:opacity protein-like surface antigen